MFKNSNFFLDVSFQNDWWFGLSPECPHGKKSYLKLNSFRTKRCCSVRTVWCLLFKLQRNSKHNFFWNTKFLAVLSRRDSVQECSASGKRSKFWMSSPPCFFGFENCFQFERAAFRVEEDFATLNDKSVNTKRRSTFTSRIRKQVWGGVRSFEQYNVYKQSPTEVEFQLQSPILINFMIKIDLSFEASGNGRTASLHLQKPSREVG